jgi:hypothetical protein
VEAPRGEVDAVALRDLLLDVEIELAHDAGPDDTGRSRAVPRGGPEAPGRARGSR